MQRQVLLLTAALALVACDREERKPAPREGAGVAGLGPAHRVDASVGACKAGDPCALTVKLTALGDFKVNEEYPFKFVPADAAGVTMEPGVFEHVGKQAGTMTVPFRAAAAGPVTVAGKLRLSVCTPDECRIEEEPVSVEVAVAP